jgi:hypothetical protein
MQDYQPYSAGSPWAMPQPSADASFEMLAAAFMAQQAAAMAQPLAKRYPAETLYRYYLAWEHNKQREIHSAFVASRYYHSKQWSDDEVRILRKRKQPITVKNRIKRKVDFLVGVEQRLRRDPKAYPRTPAAEEAAPRATACIRYVEDDNTWPNIASECASDALIRGAGIQWAGVKIIKGRPEIRKHKVPSDRFFYDPRSEMWDFSDARYLGEHQWMDIDEAIELLPFAADLIENLASTNAGDLAMLPQEFAKQHNWIDWVDFTRRRIRLISIWYKCKGRWMFDYIVASVSLCPPEMDCLSPYWHEDDDGDEGQRDHPYRAWSPYIDESNDRYGVVRDMIPIQDEINKRTSKLLHMLTLRQTIGEKGAVDDVGKMKEELAKPDGHVERNPGLEFDVIDQTPQIQGQFELLQEAKLEIENLGPNPGLIGRGVESQSGRAILAQQNSGMTELSPVFERLREWKLRCYRKDWCLMRQFWNGERYVRITSDPQALEFLAVNKIVEDPTTGAIVMENSIVEMDVDIILDEGPDTITMREELIEAISDRPDIPTEFIIELSNLPDKDMLLRKMQEYKAPPPELVALQEKMAKLEEWLKASEIDKNVAAADKSRADTMAVLAPIGANTATMAMEFPVHYREPSFIDQNRLANAAKAQMQQQAAAQEQSGGAPNALSGPTQPVEAGNPQPQNPLMMQEPPQPGQPGSLPLGPGVG